MTAETVEQRDETTQMQPSGVERMKKEGKWALEDNCRVGHAMRCDGRLSFVIS